MAPGGSGAERAAAAAAAYAASAERLLAMPFTSVTEYLTLLREASVALGAADAHAMMLLAAAVSDFYVPDEDMPEHKIQSAGSSQPEASGGDAGGGGLRLDLKPVPKMLGAIKQGQDGAAGWAPRVFSVSFKLETNQAILLAKAAGAISKYGVDVVCANLLQSYKREVTLVTATAAHEDADATRGPKRAKGVAPVSVRGDE